MKTIIDYFDIETVEDTLYSKVNLVSIDTDYIPLTIGIFNQKEKQYGESLTIELIIEEKTEKNHKGPIPVSKEFFRVDNIFKRDYYLIYTLDGSGCIKKDNSDIENINLELIQFIDSYFFPF